ncbi:hypothetical protein SAY87_006466 [Trapa incisa]|uniref:Uncharacterized protein n=1 Tax=Trapa incisa TaxID=236973 RepID=A0AAN7JZH5_9MYRT|nr:hypothetical protein SAY87_006466 [Trapa incisa]
MSAALQRMSCCREGSKHKIYNRSCDERGDESKLMKEFAKYLALGKNLKRQISKSLRDLKSKCSNWSPSESEPNTKTTFSMFRKAELASFAVFGSSLSLSGPKAQSKAISWSLITKFIVSSKRVSPRSRQVSLRM